MKPQSHWTRAAKTWAFWAVLPLWACLAGLSAPTPHSPPPAQARPEVPVPSQAQAGDSHTPKVLTAPPILSDPVQASFEVPKWRSPGHITLTLRLTLAPGHKIYGPKGPNDTLSFPTQVECKHPGVTITAHWPPAQESQDYGLRTHVYRDQVHVPLDIHFAQADQATACQLPLMIRGMVCAKGCQPLMLPVTLTIPQKPQELVQGSLWTRLWHFGGSAFLGGLILNVMPCVLPVLGLKLKGFVAVSPGAFRRGCAFSAAGIFTAFLGLGGTLALLKQGLGAHIEWGMHLKNPLFCVLLVLLMVASAYSFLGVFHLNPPRWSLNAASTLIRRPVQPSQPASGTAGSGSGWAAFGSGVLAVLLATPCSAPFLAPALAAALAGSWFDIVVVHLALGTGFALPYLLGLIFPVYRFLPKPGAWMHRVEHLMSYGLLAAAGWLVLYPLSVHLTPWAQKVSMAVMAIWTGTALAYPWLKAHLDRALVKASVYGLPLALGGALALLPFVGSGPSGVSMQDGAVIWQPFSLAALKASVDRGKIVFVDVTGIACTTCAVNKRVLMAPQVQKALTQPGVVCLRADYSHPSREISQFLADHKRATYPFNAFFISGRPKPVILSEWLTQAELLSALNSLISAHNPSGDKPTKHPLPPATTPVLH